MVIEKESVVAVSVEELNQFGCPYCGFRSGHNHLSIGGSATWECGECGKTCCALSKGVTKSVIGFGPGFFPELQMHPRRGILSHGKPDIKPGAGGEFFRPRPIGLDACTCFVCGTNDRDGEGHDYLNNIAAFVQCKEAGERVVAMFVQGARLDYRDFEPDRVQVKIGACDLHRANLEKLRELTKDGIITVDRIKEAMV